MEALLARITYLGELGYELYVPAGSAPGVYDALLDAGEPHGIRPVGLQALSSLRMEKAYRDFGHDIDNTDCPLEVGLGFALALEKPGGFVGRDAVLARKAANAAAGGMAQRLVQLRLLDPEPLLYHAEIVRRDGVDGRLRPRRVVRLDARRRGRPGDGLRRRRAGHRGLAEVRDLGGRRRRAALSGRGLAATDVRPELGAGQGLSDGGVATRRRRPVDDVGGSGRQPRSRDRLSKGPFEPLRRHRDRGRVGRDRDRDTRARVEGRGGRPPVVHALVSQGRRLRPLLDRDTETVGPAGRAQVDRLQRAQDAADRGSRRREPAGHVIDSCCAQEPARDEVAK